MVNKYLDKTGAEIIISKILDMDAEWSTTVQTLNNNIAQATEVIFGQIVGLDFQRGEYDDTMNAWNYDQIAVTPNAHTIYIDVVKNEIYRWGGSSYVVLSGQIPTSTVQSWFA